MHGMQEAYMKQKMMMDEWKADDYDYIKQR